MTARRSKTRLQSLDQTQQPFLLAARGGKQFSMRKLRRHDLRAAQMQLVHRRSELRAPEQLTQQRRHPLFVIRRIGQMHRQAATDRGLRAPA